METIHLTEQHIINKNHTLFNYCNTICFQSKNLYNFANYIIRQEFIDNNKWLRYQDIYKLVKNEDVYKMMKSDSGQQILRLLDKNWISFFNSIKDWTKNKNKYTGKPKLPKYKDKNGKNIFISVMSLTVKNGKITLPMLLNEDMIHLTTKQKNQYYKDNGLERSYIKTKLTSNDKIKQLRIIPRSNCYVIELVYEKTTNKTKSDNDKYLAIDIGLNNLATCVNNQGLKPFVINGKIIKSINYYYNKKQSKYKSILKTINNKDYSERLRKLTLKRNNKIKDYMHKASRYIINHCMENNINTIFIGKNKDWKRNIELGKKNNQNFVQIPFEMFINMMIYKGKIEGINVILNEESYTSKCSFIDNEKICKHENYVGKRVKRGLFVSKDGIKINADVNGAYNIMKKAASKILNKQISIEDVKGVVLHPIIINL